MKGVIHLAFSCFALEFMSDASDILALRAQRLELYVPVRVNFGSILHSNIVYDLIVVIVIVIVGFNDVQNRIVRGRRL